MKTGNAESGITSKATHTHSFSPRRKNGKVEFCACGKWRHSANAGPSIVAVEHGEAAEHAENQSAAPINVKASELKEGDRLNRFGHFHPVLKVERGQHPNFPRLGECFHVFHDCGNLWYTRHATVEVLPQIVREA